MISVSEFRDEIESLILLTQQVVKRSRKSAKMKRSLPKSWKRLSFSQLKSNFKNIWKYWQEDKFNIKSFSYHQKYRLQGHKDLAKEVGMTPKLLQTSHLAARLNGYLVGVGGVKQFNEEAENLGLNKKQIQYVLHYLKINEAGGLSC